MKIFAFILSIAAYTTLVAGEKPYAPESMPGTTIVSAEEVIEMILADPELIVIDSRKKTEYVKGHIEGAINILNTELELEGLESVIPDRLVETGRVELNSINTKKYNAGVMGAHHAAFHPDGESFMLDPQKVICS